MEPLHHIINIHKGGEDEKRTVFFSVDFELVEFSFPRFNTNLKVWQHIVDFTCNVLSKEKRVVSAFNEYPDKHWEDNYVWEYLGTGGFYWKYFIETKIYHVNRFFAMQDYYTKDMLDEDCLNFYHHRDCVGLALKKQGIIKGQGYYEISQNFIDRLIRQIQRI